MIYFLFEKIASYLVSRKIVFRIISGGNVHVYVHTHVCQTDWSSILIWQVHVHMLVTFLANVYSGERLDCIAALRARNASHRAVGEAPSGLSFLPATQMCLLRVPPGSQSWNYCSGSKLNLHKSLYFVHVNESSINICWLFMSFLKVAAQSNTVLLSVIMWEQNLIVLFFKHPSLRCI